MWHTKESDDNEQDCIAKIHVELACTIEANEEEDRRAMATRMEIHRVRRIR